MTYQTNQDLSLGGDSDPDRNLPTTERLADAIAAGKLPSDLLICGAAGTGKTYGILAVLHLLATDYPDLRILMARATRASLSESVLVTFEQEILPADGMRGLASGQHRSRRRLYKYPSGSEIVLGGLDNPQRILSTSWDIIYINEAIEITEEAWETLWSRLGRPGRHPDLGILIGDTNPGDPSHWLKKRMETGATTVWDTSHEANPALFDGLKWTPAGLACIEKLDRLTGTRRKRLRHGLWAAGEGAWFESFDTSRHVSPLAEYDPSFPVHLATDNNGLHTGAVWFQIRDGDDGPSVTIFGDYYNPSGVIDGFNKALEIKDRCHQLHGGLPDYGTHDPASGARLGFNTTIAAEYERAGLKLRPWPTFSGSVLSGINLIESFMGELTIHPRCSHMIAAFSNYLRANRGGQWVDQPADPQHPHEDMIDSLRGGLLAKFPGGRRPDPLVRRVHATRVF